MKKDHLLDETQNDFCSSGGWFREIKMFLSQPLLAGWSVCLGRRYAQWHYESWFRKMTMALFGNKLKMKKCPDRVINGFGSVKFKMLCIQLRCFCGRCFGFHSFFCVCSQMFCDPIGILTRLWMTKVSRFFAGKWASKRDGKKTYPIKVRSIHIQKQQSA